ncbi:paraquat-inducible protein A [Celeribacter sp. HF31]|uniref:paraquat-inducible protein A n=1 Tax=Celeribacter sp. HF31 TaxID=2721558 RepID=UPI00142F9468|nr:paraquat-inducible protein A [Celeribacter sp. HF31]NIY80339.1 paraquat-inducible protein A [Celeribacter sp. HF31]
MSKLRLLNLSLLILFPIAWAAPLLKAGLLPLFALSEISVLSGIGALWEKDKFLALVVVFFAILAPIGKVLAMEGLLSGRLSDNLSERVKPWLYHLGRLAMADVFLIAIYITVAKGIGVGRLEVGWGLYLFTLCVLVSLGLSIFTKKKT